MAFQIDRVDEENGTIKADDFARLHQACLPDSVLSGLSEKRLANWYRYVMASADFTIIAALHDQKLAGVAIIQHRVEAKITGLLDLSDKISLVFNQPSLLASTVFSVFGKITSPSSEALSEMPELLYIFVAKALRGRACGQALLSDIMLRFHGSSLRVLTQADEINPALGFYQAQGFEKKHIIKRAGKQMQILEIEISER